jgi:hypothetical protein
MPVIFSAKDPMNKTEKMLIIYYSSGVGLLLIGGALSVPNVIIAGFIMLGLTFCANMMMPMGELTYEQEYGHFPKSRGSSLCQEELAVP